MNLSREVRVLTCLIIALVAALGLTIVAYGHEAGTPWAEWFMSLKQPDNPIASCCGPADQFYATEYHEDPDTGGFIVTIDGFDKPARVPPEKVNWNDVNPTGRGVIFMTRNWQEGESTPGHVYCFIPGDGV